MGEVIKLPSNYQVGDEVCLSFGTGPLIPKCHITKVIFTRSKILYDVEIPIYEPGETNDGSLPMCVGHTRIHSVDSAFVKPFARVKWEGIGMEWFDEQGTVKI